MSHVIAEEDDQVLVGFSIRGYHERFPTAPLVPVDYPVGITAPRGEGLLANHRRHTRFGTGDRDLGMPRRVRSDTDDVDSKHDVAGSERGATCCPRTSSAPSRSSGSESLPCLPRSAQKDE